MMRVSVGVSVYTVDNEDTRAISVGSNRTKSTGKQSHRLGEQTKQFKKVKRRKTERRGKEEAGHQSVRPQSKHSKTG